MQAMTGEEQTDPRLSTDSRPLIVYGDFVWTGTELLRDAAVLCSNGIIEVIGTRTELRASYPDAVIVGGSGRIVLPGLINAHHHGNGITSFARGVMDDNLEPWLASLGAGPSVDPHLDTLLAALDTVQGGYTTMVLFQSTSDPARALDEAVARIDAARAVGLRVAFGLDVVQRNFYVYGPNPEGLPSRNGLATKDYIALLDELRRRYEADPLVGIFAAPSGPEWVTDGAWSAVGEWSRRHRLPLHTHALESPLQAEYARRQFPDGLVAHLDRLGALHESTSLVHGVYLQGEDFDRMAERGAHLITNPGSNLRLRCGISPVLLALERGVHVALGTDGCSLGDRDDAFAEMRQLFYLQREAGIDAPSLTWQQAFSMSADNAARVTPWGGEVGIGAIAPGRPADFSVYDLDAAVGPWVHPDVHPVHVLLHRGARTHVDAIVVDGRVVWTGSGGAEFVDEKDAMGRVQRHIQFQPPADGSGKTLVETVTDYYRRWLEGDS